MAKQKSNINTLYIGAVGGASPPTTPGKVLNKKGLTASIKNITDETTTDDSTGPEKMTVYAGIIESVKFTQVIDLTDATYTFLTARLEDGAALLCSYRPDGDGAGKRQGIFQAIVVERGDPNSPEKIATRDWTLEATGGTTWSNQ